MRRRLYLMRHAEVSYFAEDGTPFRQQAVALTERGRKQAEAARAALAGIELDRVVTSGLPRTLETARLVAPDREPEAWPELREWEGGRLADLAEDELEQAFVGALRARDEDARFLGGETLHELLDRVLPAAQRLVAEEWETALAVLHGAVNRVILSQALAGGRAYFGGFEQAPCCINVLDLGEDGWVVRTVNYVPYDPLAPARTTTMEEYWAQYRPAR
jgi:probable phosphoglycerate mutase